MSVSGHAIFGSDVRAGHLQQIELRGDLKERVGVGGVAVHRAGFAGYR